MYLMYETPISGYVNRVVEVLNNTLIFFIVMMLMLILTLTILTVVEVIYIVKYCRCCRFFNHLNIFFGVTNE
jgi:hypothetical protein